MFEPEKSEIFIFPQKKKCSATVTVKLAPTAFVINSCGSPQDRYFHMHTQQYEKRFTCLLPIWTSFDTQNCAHVPRESDDISPRRITLNSMYVGVFDTCTVRHNQPWILIRDIGSGVGYM